jgi:hypothetical protein
MLHDFMLAHDTINMIEFSLDLLIPKVFIHAGAD